MAPSPAPAQIDASDVDVHGGYIFVLLSRMVFDMRDEGDASLALQFSFVLKMLFSTDKGWQLRTYLQDNYAEELKYVLVTGAGRDLVGDIAKNCLTAGWVAHTYWEVLRLSSISRGRRLVEDDEEEEGRAADREYDTFSYIRS